ncbi:hypothetical protein ACNOYE_00585 [Nannocystaceae bacterium ST9]
MPTNLLFTALLFLAPASTPPEVDADTYLALIDEIERLTGLINEGEEVGDDLEEAIKRMSDHAPLLAVDAEGQRSRTNALLILARARLLTEQSSEAAAAMDEAIRLTGDEDLSVGDYGPALEALYEERRALLAEEGMATLQVVCTTPCTVYIDEQVAKPGVSQVSLGIHRVWIEASQPGSITPAETHRVNLDAPGAIAHLTYSPVRAPVPRPKPAPRIPPPKHLLPVWAEGTMMAVGAGLVIVGAILLASDTDRGIPAGATLVSLGGASAIAGGTLLGIDQSRERAYELATRTNGKSARVMVGWTFRF